MDDRMVTVDNIVTPRPTANRFSRLRRLPLLPIIILAVFVLAAIVAPLITPYSPYDFSLADKLRPPAWQAGGSPDFPLGTDRLGRDIFTRILYGSRISFLVAILSLLVGAGIGTTVGIVSAYFRGWVDTVLMRIADAALGIPSIFIALLFAISLGAGFRTVILAIALVLWAQFARVIRGEVLSLRERDFVTLARIAGAPHIRVILKHLLPNVMNTLLVLMTLNVGQVILMEASLSFLGAGIPPPSPSWGQMVADGREYIELAWWISIIPGVALALVVLAFNLFGDWLRDAIDPKLRQL